jgi:hypothetical protein
MTRKFLTSSLCLALLSSPLLAATEGGETSAKNSAAVVKTAQRPDATPQNQTSTSTTSTTRPTSSTSRSYARETHRRHPGVSRNEAIFMGAVAGTSMGIGAIAGGGVGLAIGAIVGGWGAYASHRLWHYFNK